jgi:hypothetical protein
MPEVRLGQPGPTTAACRSVSLDSDRRPEPVAPPRTVTSAQLDQAVRQLRERRGRPAAEQMQAVLRALDLTVVHDNEHRR